MHLYSGLSTLLTQIITVQALPSILLYTKTAGFRHDSIPTAIRTIEGLGNGDINLHSSLVDQDIRDFRWITVATEDESLFEQQGFLEQFDAVAFVLVTDVDPPGEGTILRTPGIERLAEHIQQGGGFIGVHSATNALYGTPFYGRLVGAFFSYHVGLESQSFSPASGVSHPSINNLPPIFNLQEEVYNYRTDPRNLSSPATILITPASNVSSNLDPGASQSWRNGSNSVNSDEPHPLAWWREGGLMDSKIPGPMGGGLDDSANENDGQVKAEGGPGRSWYTSLGHESESWNGYVLRSHIFGGIAWTLASKTVKSNDLTALVGGSSVGDASPTSRDGSSANPINGGGGGSGSGSGSGSGIELNAESGASVVKPLLSLFLSVAVGAALLSY